MTVVEAAPGPVPGEGVELPAESLTVAALDSV
jgi:hypothetical protein